MTILVTGATGSVGRKVVDALLASGAQPGQVRALTVDPVRAALPVGVEVVEGTMSGREPARQALDGVDRVYLAPEPGSVERFMGAVRDAGVSRVVDLSGEPESWWGGVTVAVEASGVPWTHLWPWDFMENALVLAEQVRTHGTVREPWPEASSTPTAMDDIAAVAAQALLHDGHEGATYALTGPQALTRAGIVAELGRVLEREVAFVAVGRDEAVTALEPAMGEQAAWYVDTILAGSATAAAAPTTVVSDVLGRPAKTFAQWAQENADAFR